MVVQHLYFQVGENSSDIISVDINNIESRQMGQADPFKLKNFITGFNTMPMVTILQSTPGSGIQLLNDLSNRQKRFFQRSGNFMIEIPAGKKNLTIHLDDYGSNDTIQIFTKDGVHVATVLKLDIKVGILDIVQKI